MSILTIGFTTTISGVILKIGINIDILINSKTVNVKKLNKLDRKAKLRSILPNAIKEINNKIIKKTVCTPKGIGNSLTRYAEQANTIPRMIIFFQSSGILAITKAKVTTAICSGIP